MEEILVVVRQITVFILLFSLVSNLFSRSKYSRYFAFVQGLLVILLVMRPVLGWFASDQFVDEFLDGNMIDMERRLDEDQLRIIGEQREMMLGNQKER